VRLIHVLTDHVLHSHGGFSHPEWTLGQQEVTCYPWRDDNDWWLLLEPA
jgi:dolichyl-phosphate-mannose--protein O-mannosyl transferase